MRVVVAAHDLYPDPGSGGSGRYVYETSRRLVERGHRVTVVTRRRGDVPRRGTVDGVDVRRYDFEVADRAAPAILRQLPSAVRAVREAVTPLDPDLFSVQGLVTGTLVDAALPDDLPRSCVFHSPWPTEYRIRSRRGGLAPRRRRWNVALRRRLEGRLLDRVDVTMTLSRFMRTQLQHVYGRRHSATVVPGGVDLERYRPGAGDGGAGPADADGAGGDETTFLTVRRLSPRMGHDLLLDSFAVLAERRDDVSLHIAGDGPLREDLEARARRRGVADRVSFLGYVPDADLPGVYAAADVFVLPTTELEGFGLATLEALASGTPVVGTPVGGTVELLEDCEARLPVDAAMLLPAVDRDALTDALDRWATLPAEACARAGRTCREYAREQYPWERTVDALETAYLERVE